MIVNKYKYGGGGSGSGSTYTAGEYIQIAEDVISVTGITPDQYITSAYTGFTKTEDFDDLVESLEGKEEVVASALTQLEGSILEISGSTQDFVTEADITAATSPIQTQLDDVERVTATALTELHDAILEISGSTGGSNFIIPAITRLDDYEAISGDVKTGDLIQVHGVDINDDGEDESGLFENVAPEGEIDWERRDNADSLMWADRVYPWMTENGTYPIDFGPDAFLISEDAIAGDGSFNGIGFDDNGKPVITHIVPQTVEQTGEITGITREDVPLGPDQVKEEVIAAALVDLDERVEERVESQDVKHIVKLTQSDYDALVTKDPYTFYIIIN